MRQNLWRNNDTIRSNENGKSHEDIIIRVNCDLIRLTTSSNVQSHQYALDIEQDGTLRREAAVSPIEGIKDIYAILKQICSSCLLNRN